MTAFPSSLSSSSLARYQEGEMRGTNDSDKLQVTSDDVNNFRETIMGKRTEITDSIRTIDAELRTLRHDRILITREAVSKGCEKDVAAIEELNKKVIALTTEKQDLFAKLTALPCPATLRSDSRCVAWIKTELAASTV